MDVEAIMQAKDNELLLLGLDKKGDILSLRNFVQKLSKESSNDEKRSKKMSLLHEVLENGKQNKSLKQKKDGKFLPKMRKVQLGWLHFDAEKQSFVSVRMAKGGGTGEVEIELNADKDDIIGIAKSIFFTDGNSNFGPEQLMTFGLANFQHKDV
ncbi:uncharacterized protein LOC111334886 [Stylophora pistillata]|uniref:uncharacterized protein LOC111334886 n=1 Tax=Stylophora pistillata TaxID=50429 RepID=UPI000C03E4D3|nr:uncharacterized protein LOC111334886 [Stylophora pistillata]